MSTLSEARSEFWRSYTSKVGTFFIILLTIISIVVVLTMPLDFGTKYWSNPIYWVDNPKASPPAWINTLMQDKLIEHQIISSNAPAQVEDLGGSYMKQYILTYDFKYSQFPSFLTFRLTNLVFYDKPPIIRVYIVRPDNKLVSILTYPVTVEGLNQTSPNVLFKSEPKRFLLSGDP